jgi:CMP-N,N'-diacetyllegionaminic acid synthase
MSKPGTPSSISVLGIIPARGGSKGISRKNIVPVGGKPLIAYTIAASQESQLLTACIVSTDDSGIADVCRQCGANVPFLRPSELASDTARAQDVVLHALEHLSPDAPYDYVLLLQPTAPFRTGADIDASIRLALAHDADSVVSFTQEETHHPYYMYFVDETSEFDTPSRVRQAYDYEVGTPRQQFPPAVYRNGAIYLTRVSFLREKGSFVSEDVVPYMMPASRSVNIDEPQDILYAEFLFAKTH